MLPPVYWVQRERGRSDRHGGFVRGLWRVRVEGSHVRTEEVVDGPATTLVDARHRLTEARMEVLETSLGRVPVLRVTGEIDHGTAPVFAEAVRKVLRPDGSRLLLDLSDCIYFDSGGLAVILSIVRDFRAQGWLA